MRFRPVVVVVSFVLLAFGCGKDPDIESSEKAMINSFFSSNNLDSVVQDGVFIHIGNMLDPGRDRDSEPVVQWGDSLYLKYELHAFTSLGSSLTDPFYILGTNKENLIRYMYGPDSHLDTNPLQVKLGSSKMVEGVNRGLPNCRQGDSVLLFLTSDLGFGDDGIGVVEANTPLVYIFNIEKVKKQ